MLEIIHRQFDKLTKRLNAPAEHSEFRTTPKHDGSAHCEYDGTSYRYIVTERGHELERRMTVEADELLFWLISDVALLMALRFELCNRDPNAVGIDSRRVWMPHQVELLRSVRESWADRMAAEHKSRLLEHPYIDG